jgi:hypothetical protein
VNTEKQCTTSGADGALGFAGKASHAVQREARAAGAKSERVTLRR